MDAEGAFAPPPPLAGEPKDLWYVGAIINVVSSVVGRGGLSSPSTGPTGSGALCARRCPHLRACG